MAQFLVTGATGFLGSVLTRRLVSEGKSVRIYRRDRSSLDLLEGIERKVEHAVGDLLDPISTEEALASVEFVYHAAARVGFGGRGERREIMRANVDGTSIVVNAALKAGARRMVHVSSMAAFGRPELPEGVIDENTEWLRSRVNSVYAKSKYLSELEIRRGVAEGLDAVIVNPALIFGGGRPGDNTRRLVDRIKSGSLPAIPAGGTNVVDVEDVVDGMIRAMDRGKTGERYFLGSENLSWEEIIRTLAEALDEDPPRLKLRPLPALMLAYGAEGLSLVTGSTPLITRETARTASRTYRYSNRKAQCELGWDPRPFRETAHRIADQV